MNLVALIIYRATCGGVSFEGPVLSKTSRSGSVSVIVAITMPVLLAMVDIATEYGFALVELARNQRVADSAAFAGALAYNTYNTTSAMNNAVSSIAALNANLSDDTTASLVTSPRGDGNSAVRATVTTPYRIILFERTLSLTRQSYVEIVPGGSPCIIALSGTGTGVTLSGGTKLSASACTVASNQSVVVPCGTDIYSNQVTWDTTAPTQGCNGIQPYSGGGSATIRQVLTPDPIAANTEVASDRNRLTTVGNLTSPPAPTVSGGTSLSFGWGSSSMSTGTACTATFSGSTWTVTCPAGGTYNFGAITLGGGITVNFDVNDTTSTYNFSGVVNDSGTALHFGSGTFNMAGGLTTGGGSTTTFGGGTFNIGTLASSCNGASVSICNTGSSLTFTGPVTMNLTAGLYNSGGETLSIGAGTTGNSYTIGKSSTGYGIYVGGGAFTTLGDSYPTSSTFKVIGSIGSGGGSCLTLPRSNQHDIDGSIALAGGLTMGAGTYTVTGYVDFGGNGGGNVTCGGSSIGVTASGVTLVIGGSTTPNDNCSGQAFCVGAGFSTVTITAPTQGADTSLAVIGPQSLTAGASFTEGATNTQITGVFYFPEGPVTLTGGASLGSTNTCLELIGSQITLSGGTTLGSDCPGVGSSNTSSTVTLVQ